MRKIIKTEELTANDLPDKNANWDEISTFALSFDPQVELGRTDVYNVSNTEFDDASSIQELRLSLFLWQRFWNNRRRNIDEEGLSKLRKIIELMRLKQ